MFNSSKEFFLQKSLLLYVMLPLKTLFFLNIIIRIIICLYVYAVLCILCQIFQLHLKRRKKTHFNFQQFGGFLLGGAIHRKSHTCARHDGAQQRRSGRDFVET